MKVSHLRAKAVGLAAAALAVNSVLAIAAADVPDIKGLWTGKTFTIVAGAAPHWPNNTGTFTNPGLGEKDLVINITNQQGRRFWGTAMLSGDGGKPDDEPFIGELYGPANRKVIIDYDTEMYRWRHLVENYFAKLKEFRSIATRYDKTAESFSANINLAAAMIAAR